MTNGEMAESFFGKAASRLKILAVLMEDRAYSDVVRESQECVELLLKAALRYVGVEPARSHDVSRVLTASAGKFPPWFQDHLQELAKISTELAEERGPSFYGDEQRMVPPSELYDEKDARDAVQKTEFVHTLCTRLLQKDR